jgi:Glu-tRNA(Gln) amidotransferase subunit E-like FAD-binding protein
MDYKTLELKCGLEIHRQLDTKNKLFCYCSTGMIEKNPITLIKRKQHPVASELGRVDIAAQYEFLRDRTFHYQVFHREDCLVECDEEPINPLNKEALEVALQIALLLSCEIPEEVQVMRKTVIDGSNTSAFQRTLIVGLNGYIEYDGKKVEITHVALEEDAASIVEEDEKDKTYKLNRLSVPLIEIGTGLLIGYTPEEVQEIAYLIGMTCRSTGKVKRGIGSVRQDLNVSVKNGPRVEIKGVQELGLISKAIQLEVQRQTSLPEVKKEVRAASADGTTKFTRPLPGAERMYPETDIPPIPIDGKMIQRIKKNLPESWIKKMKKFKTRLKLSDELTKQIIRSDYLELFEKIVKKFRVNPSVVANVFVSTLKDLQKRENVQVEKLEDKDFEELFRLLKEKKLMKEAIPNVIKYKIEHADEPMIVGIKKLGLGVISNEDLMRIVKEVIDKNRGTSEGKIIGLVMSHVRGRVKSENVVRIVKRKLK